MECRLISFMRMRRKISTSEKKKSTINSCIAKIHWSFADASPLINCKQSMWFMKHTHTPKDHHSDDDDDNEGSRLLRKNESERERDSSWAEDEKFISIKCKSVYIFLWNLIRIGIGGQEKSKDISMGVSLFFSINIFPYIHTQNSTNTT